MSSEAVCERVEAIRQERLAKQKEILDKQITWEAEVILACENIDFIKELTDSIDIDKYVMSKVLQCPRGVNGIPLNPEFKYNSEMLYKKKCFLDKVNSVRESYDYKEIIKNRKNLIQIEPLLKTKNEDDECDHMQQIIDETNNNIRKYLTDMGIHRHTFKDLTLADWDIHMKGFLAKYNDSGWVHYIVNRHEKICQPSITSLYQNTASRLESASCIDKDMVPFCTNCPICNSPTKFSYLYKVYKIEGKYQENNSSGFRFIYCDNHYFYDSKNDCHYTVNPLGKEFSKEDLILPDTGLWSYMPTCWIPTNNKWSIWENSN